MQKSFRILTVYTYWNNEVLLISFILSTTALLVNGVCVELIWRSQKLHKIPFFYIFTLAVSNAILALSIQTLFTAFSCNQNTYVFLAFEILARTALTSSTLALLLITFNRMTRKARNILFRIIMVGLSRQQYATVVLRSTKQSCWLSDDLVVVC